MRQLLASTFQDLIPRRYQPGEHHAADALSLANGKLHVEWAKLLDLRATVDYRAFDRQVGALLNWRNPDSRPTMVFGWDIKGTHVYDLAENLPSLYDNWVRGLGGIAPYHTWKIHVGTAISSQQRTAELTQRLYQTENPGLIQLFCDEIARCQELTRNGWRGERFIHLYVYYWGSRDHLQGDADDAVEAGIRESWQLFKDLRALVSGRKTKSDAKRMEDIFRSSYYNGFQSVQNLLSGTFGMAAQPMTEPELWANLRQRFTGEAAGSSPYKITCDINQTGLRLTEMLEPEHICNVLVRDAPPILSEQGICIKRWHPELERYQEDYIGVLEARHKLGGWSHEYHQAKGLWDIFAVADLPDLELVVEISPGSAKAQRENAKDTFRQAAKKQAEAARTSDYNAYASRTLTEAREQMDEFFLGSIPFRVAMVLLVHADSPERLDLACRDVISHFKLATLEREYTCASRIWLQTLPCFEEHLLQLKIKILHMGYPMPTIDINFRHYYSQRQTMGFLPFATTQPNDLLGIEFVAWDKQVVMLDLFSHGKEKHWLATARQRKGKSFLGIDVAFYALALGQPVTILDSPPPDDSSSLKDIAGFVAGSHVDVNRESFNLLSIPKALLLSSSQLSREKRTDRFKILQQFWIEVLLILGGPTESEAHLLQVTKDLLELGLDLYLQDPGIQQRYDAAVAGGFGTDAWQHTPTLADFVLFTKRFKLQHHLHRISGAVDQALNLLDLRLSRKADPSTTIGAAIARPSTVDLEASLYTVFSLRGLKAGSEESLAYCLAAYTSALQKSLSHPVSHLIIEEAQTLAGFPGVLQIISDVATRGGKAGIRLGVISNSFERLANTKPGRDLLNNLPTKAIGSIEPTSVTVLAEILHMPVELVEQCAAPTFDVNRQKGYTNWLLEDYGKHTFVRRYPSWLSAALSGSQINERNAREAFLQTFADPALAIAAYALWFRQCAEANRPVTLPTTAQMQNLADQWSAATSHILESR